MKPKKSWLIVLFPLLLFALHFPSNHLSKNDLAEKWGRKVLEGLPKNSVVLAYGDIETFLFGALLLAYKIRPDVTIYSLDESFGPLPGEVKKGYPIALLTNLLETLTTRPIYHFGLPGGTPQGWANISDGFLYFLKKEGSEFTSRGKEAQQFFQEVISPYTKKQILSAWEKELVSQASTMIISNGLDSLPKNSSEKELLPVLEESKKYADDSPFGWYLIGHGFGKLGPAYHAVALEMLKKSIELAQEKNLKPPFQSYLILAWSHFESNQVGLAKKYARKALSYNLYNPEAYFLLAKIALTEKDLKKGREYLSKTLQLNPQHEKAKELLSNLLIKETPWHPKGVRGGDASAF